MTVRELVCALPLQCNVVCRDNESSEVVFISHGSGFPCEGNRKHMNDEVKRIISSNTHLMSGDMEVLTEEMI